jgi:hypothetical protein
MNSSGSVKPFNPAGKLSTWTTILLVIVILLTVWELVSANKFLSSVNKLDEGRQTLTALQATKLLRDAENAADQADTASVLRLIDGLVFLILFIVWVYRVHTNLPALGADHLRYSSGRAVLVFFVPLVNVIAEIWQASDPDALKEGAGKRREAWLAAGIWWLTLFGVMAAALYTGGVNEPAQSQWASYVQYTRDWVNAVRVYDVAIILFAILTIVVVQKITGNQHQRDLRYRALQLRVKEDFDSLEQASAQEEAVNQIES